MATAGAEATAAAVSAAGLRASQNAAQFHAALTRSSSVPWCVERFALVRHSVVPSLWQTSFRMK